MAILYFPFCIFHFSSFLFVCSRKETELTFTGLFILESLYNDTELLPKTAFVASQSTPQVGHPGGAPHLSSQNMSARTHEPSQGEPEGRAQRLGQE